MPIKFISFDPKTRTVQPAPNAPPTPAAQPAAPEPAKSHPVAPAKSATARRKGAAPSKASRDPLTDATLTRDRRRRSGMAMHVREADEAPRHGVNEPRGLETINMPIERLAPALRRGRKVSAEQSARLRASLRRFGFRAPVLIDGDGHIISGHGLVEAARDLGMASVPVVRCDDLSAHEAEMLALSLNRLGETGEWDIEALAPIFEDMATAEEDMTLAGFEDSFVDSVLVDEDEALRPEKPLDVPETVTSRPGDVWMLDDHRVACMDGRDGEALGHLSASRELRCAFVDPPYNVPIKGFVTSRAHKTFVMGTGEMSDEVFLAFLAGALRTLIEKLVPGGVVFACMDWRSIDKLMEAGRIAGFEVFNLCVWSKGVGGQPGGLYRSAHELVLVLRKPGGTMLNQVKGRYRTNVWTYPGGASLGSETREGLKSHSTPKNPAMVADAISDVSRRGELVADTFLGGGTTLIAAERTGRVFVGGDLDPMYVDVAVLRWQRETGHVARLQATGETFGAVAARRQTDPDPQAGPDDTKADVAGDPAVADAADPKLS